MSWKKKYGRHEKAVIRRCKYCRGTGKTWRLTCQACKGSGYDRAVYWRPRWK
jgi:DnaJ-class molecular chaperone